MVSIVFPGLFSSVAEQFEAKIAPEMGAVATASSNYTYRDYAQVKAAILEIQSEYPTIAEVLDIGDSWEKTQSIADRDILALKISDNVTADEDEPEVLVTALHHAREWTTTEIAVALAGSLVGGYGIDPQISWLVDNREVWIVPIVNPDGLDYSLSFDHMWRKNRRLNTDLTYGVDLNRNYGGASNGDPLGDWGGAGSSSLASSDVYRGEAAFSEPETQAIRNLVLERNFTMALDFHSFGDFVLWPWGYTTNYSPDRDDFSRIGSELAAANGYVSQQSVALYPTTGDSIDWMYGCAGIYAFILEVGDEFHPANASVVAQSVLANVNASILGIDIAGDRAERAFSIMHTPVAVANYTEAGYSIAVNVTADRGVDDATVSLHYSLDGCNWTRVHMVKSGGNDTYSAQVPSVPVWHNIDYYFSARDQSGVLDVAPRYAPYWMYGLLVTPPPGLIGGIDFFIPPVIDGTTGYTFYASAEAYPDPFWLDLELNFTEGWSSYRWSVEGVGGDVNCTLPRGVRLANYSARLVATLGEFTIWNSSEFGLEVADLTCPEILLVDGEVTDDPDGRKFSILVSCSDFYGVESVDVEYRIDGGLWQKSTRNASLQQDDREWRFFLAIDDKGGILEYRVFVKDSRNIASSSLTSFSIPRITSGIGQPGTLYIAVSVIAAASVVLTIYLIIRVRRRRASGP